VSSGGDAMVPEAMRIGSPRLSCHRQEGAPGSRADFPGDGHNLVQVRRETAAFRVGWLSVEIAGLLPQPIQPVANRRLFGCDEAGVPKTPVSFYFLESGY
jgi:hypothetical protein